MGTKRPDTIPESTPRLKIRGDRYAFVSVGAEKESNERSYFRVAFASVSKRVFAQNHSMTISIRPGPSTSSFTCKSGIHS